MKNISITSIKSNPIAQEWVNGGDFYTDNTVG